MRRPSEQTWSPKLILKTSFPVRKSQILLESANSLMGSFGKGSLQKFSTNFREIFATFRRISAPFPDALKSMLANFCELSAEFPQTFCKNPFANDPISELLKEVILQSNVFWSGNFYSLIWKFNWLVLRRERLGVGRCGGGGGESLPITWKLKLHCNRIK